MNNQVKAALSKHCKTLGIPFSDVSGYGETSIEIQDVTVGIKLDHECFNPREESDETGKMVCWHRGYNLGDEQPEVCPQDYFECLLDEVEPGFSAKLERMAERFFGGDWTLDLAKAWDEKKQDLIDAGLERHFIMLPLYLYDHSGITMSTGSFSCSWDSGQVGWIYMSKADARKEWSWKRLTKKRLQQVENCLKCEVETYDAYLRGDCYGFEVESEKGDIDDSCWGFLGPDGEHWAMEHALSDLIASLKTRRQTRYEKLKQWIRSRVPLLQRQAKVIDLPALM